MSVVIRPRRPEDLPGLGVDLLEQQPRTHYPLRNPLPMPTDEFLHGDDADGAWVAERDGDVVGHVCRVGPLHGFPQAAEMNAACAAAYGCAVEQLSWVSSLFVAERGGGAGIGRMLHDAVVDDIRAAGLFPCLEVLPQNEGARLLYVRRGWRDVATVRPPWLTALVGDEGPDAHVMVLGGPEHDPAPGPGA